MTAAAKKTAAAKPKADDASGGDLGGYVVTGARIQANVGSQVLQFSTGDVLPEGIDKESLERLVDRGLVEKR